MVSFASNTEPSLRGHVLRPAVFACVVFVRIVFDVCCLLFVGVAVVQ